MKKVFILLVLIAVLALAFLVYDSKSYSNKESLHSRVWMEYAMDIVREKKPTPPEAARFYASVSTIYFENIQDENVNLKLQEFINYLYPDKKASTTEFLAKNNLRYGSLEGEESLKKDLAKYLERYTKDNQQIFDKKFVGSEYWTGENPLSPTASNWKRWNVEGVDFQVSSPPKYLSEEYKQALQEVKEAAEKRNSEQVTLINFWGGIPGTETPSGIWQNRFYNETKNLNLSDEKYAYIQMILAQSLADSFMECWKVKFTYFTKRPSMVEPTINLAMKNPNFPSYTSGHSTVSATAATVLGQFFPDKKEIFMKDAINAKNSRLWAGIHFPYDNEAGFKLGQQIGKYYIQNVIIDN